VICIIVLALRTKSVEDPAILALEEEILEEREGIYDKRKKELDNERDRPEKLRESE